MAQPTYLFVSDLHLAAESPAAVAQFAAFLDHEAREADALYILGDLFETWIGDDDDEPVRRQVCAALKAYTAHTPAYVMCGNRDFLYGPGFERLTGCTLLPDPLLLEDGELRALVTHGDLLCTDDHNYQELRSIFREPLWQKRFLALPLSARRGLADATRSGSQQHTRSTMRSIMDVNEAAVFAAFRASGTTLLIHGHTHRPGVHRYELDDVTCTRIVLGDWYDQGSCLRLNGDGSFELLELKR
ncbi:MAG: UDP-2,3-diacylglucosamine diphosphatase [Steroidobacteraceae bacterium]